RRRLALLPGVDYLALAREGAPGDRGAAAAASGVGPTGEGRGGDECPSGSGEDVDVPGESPGQDEVRRVPPGRSAADQQLDGVGRQADQPARQGERKVLVGRGQRGGAATARRPTQ